MSQAGPDAADLTPEQRAKIQEAIIKASQNPVGNIAIIPFQNNFNFGSGPYDRLQYNLNLQPVVPIMLSPSWNLVARAIIPFIEQPSFAPPSVCAGPGGCPSITGLGDINTQFYFAPKTRPGGIIWGAGPQLTFPSATDGTLSAGKYSAGPTVVGLMMPGPWVVGMLANQLWSYANGSTGATKPNVSSALFQPFVNYNMKGGWAITSAPIITANWAAAATPGNSNKWTVPLGGGFSKTFKLGDSPMQVALLYYTNVQRPLYAPQTNLRFVWSLLFPLKRGFTMPQ